MRHRILNDAFDQTNLWELLWGGTTRRGGVEIAARDAASLEVLLPHPLALIEEGVVEVHIPGDAGVWDGPVVDSDAVRAVLADRRNWVAPSESGQPLAYAARVTSWAEQGLLREDEQGIHSDR